MANMDAGHLRTVATNGVDFFGRVQQGDWTASSDHVASCTAYRVCGDLTAEDDCNANDPAHSFHSCAWNGAACYDANDTPGMPTCTAGNLMQAANRQSAPDFANGIDPGQMQEVCGELPLPGQEAEYSTNCMHVDAEQFATMTCQSAACGYAGVDPMGHCSCTGWDRSDPTNPHEVSCEVRTNWLSSREWCEQMTEQHGTIVEQEISDLIDHTMPGARSAFQIIAAALPVDGMLPRLGMEGAHGPQNAATGFDLLDFAADLLSSASWAKVATACETSATALAAVEWEQVARLANYGLDAGETFADYEEGIESFVENYESSLAEAANDAEIAATIRASLDVALQTCQEISRLMGDGGGGGGGGH